MSRLRLAAIAAAVCSMGAMAMAETRPSGYLSISGGYNFPSENIDETDVETSGGNALPNDSVSIDNGWDVAFALGAHVDKNCRLEFQYTAQSNDVDAIEITGLQEVDATGSVRSNLFMVNGIYDIALDRHKRTSIYAGVGVGALWLTWDADYRLTPVSGPALQKPIENNEGWAFAGQAMLGLSHEFMPGMHVFGGYRGWTSLDVETDFSQMDMPWFHIAEVGVRFDF